MALKQSKVFTIIACIASFVANMAAIPTPVLTTTFSPPPACSTQFADRGSIYVNPMFPPLIVGNTDYYSCYQSDFVSYYTAYAYSSLVCPDSYTTASAWDSPENYIACCPVGFDGLDLGSEGRSTRPAYLARCYSTIPEQGLTVSYSASGDVVSTSLYTPTTAGERVYAYAYDGIAVATSTAIFTGGAAASNEVSSGAIVVAASTSVATAPSVSGEAGATESQPAQQTANGADGAAGLVKQGPIMGVVAGLVGLFSYFL